jgi:NAD(P)-dependent dehydrogenase (short-subunit alcohol dehydrogenase family)
MDPAEFGISTLSLRHEPYGAILPEALEGANTGKVAIITGAGRGIGAAIAEALAKSGADLALLDINVENLVRTKNNCLALGVKVEGFGCDVTDSAKVQDVILEVIQRLGPIESVWSLKLLEQLLHSTANRDSILVNNAGIFQQRPLLMSSFDGFWREIEVNFKAVRTN